MAMIDNGAVVGDGDSKRAEKTKRLFLDESGEATPRASTKSVAGRVVFVDSNATLEFDIRELEKAHPGVVRAAALFGIMTSVTNTVGKKGMTADEMFEAAKDRLGVIMEDGEWASAREGGPRSNDLILAAVRMYADTGKVLTEELQGKMRAMLQDENTGATYRETLNANKQLMAALATIRAERATELAKKRAAEAVGAPEVADIFNL